MISFTSTSIWDHGSRWTVVPVNTDGVMGRGMALEAKRRWPWIVPAYLSALSSGDLTTKRVKYVSDPRKGLILFATKEHWYHDSRIEYVRDGMESLVQQHQHGTVSLPELGCGAGRLRFEEDVRPLMVAALTNAGIRATIHIGSSRCR